MKINKAAEKRAWFSQSLHQNPKAIFPLYLAGFGSLCWQAFALLAGASTNPSQDHFWDVLIVTGIVFMALGFIGGIVYRHYRAAALALIIALISPPLWWWLVICQWSGSFGWLPLPPLVSEYAQRHPVVIWLYYQIPLALLFLWRSSWQRRTKIGMTTLIAGGLICFFGVVTIQLSHEVTTSTYISSEYLSSIYAKNDMPAIKRLVHKRIVVTGAMSGGDEGLLGNGIPEQMNDIEYDDLVGNDSLRDGQTTSIIGTLESRDAYGKIHLANSRVVK